MMTRYSGVFMAKFILRPRAARPKNLRLHRYGVTPHALRLLSRTVSAPEMLRFAQHKLKRGSLETMHRHPALHEVRNEQPVPLRVVLDVGRRLHVLHHFA